MHLSIASLTIIAHAILPVAIGITESIVLVTKYQE